MYTIIFLDNYLIIKYIYTLHLMNNENDLRERADILLQDDICSTGHMQ